MILVWGIRRDGTEEQQQRARWLFESLEQQDDAQIIIPSVVLAEYLSPVKESEHANVMAEVSNRFIVAPFDVRCASLAAKLFKSGRPDRSTSGTEWRKCLRADTLIIATAKIHGAKVLYSGDRNCLSLARSVMDARDLPDQPPHLFAYDKNE